MFEDRLIVNNDGKVTLNDLTPDDHGRYRVEYQLAENKHTYNISLVIKEPPETIDGKLFVMKKYSPNENSVRLMCGMFTTLGFPPASAVWKDPAGRTLSSDGFKDEYFYLDVPADTADSGDYCCQLDCRAPDFCCLDDQPPLRSCATVHVQTNKKIEVTTTPNSSLQPFTKLEENVSNSTKNLVDLSELHIQNCSNQADEYMGKVQRLEEDIRKELENVVNISAEARRQLEKETMKMFWNFQLQVDYNLSIAVESCREHFMKAATGLESKLTNTSDKVEAMEQRLDTKLTEIQQYSDKADGRLETNMNHSIESLQNFQRQLDYNMSLSLESFKELQKRLIETDMRQELAWTSVLDKVEALRKKLDKGGEIEIQISEVSGIVDELKQRIDVDLAEIRTSGLAADIILEANMNHSFEILQSFQLQLDYNISRAVNSLNEIMKQLVTSSRDLDSKMINVSNQVEKLSQRLDKDGEMDVRLTRISDKVETQAQRLGTDLAELRIVTANGDKTLETNTNRSLANLQSRMQDIAKTADSYVSLFNETIKNLQTKSTNELSNLRQAISSDVSKLENRLIQMISEVRSSNQAGLADLRSKTDNRVSAIESRLSAIERRFDSHVTTNSQLMATIRSDIDKSGQCWKKGYTWHSAKCFKVHHLNKPYSDAKRFCEAEGAHLYIIKSRGVDEAPLRFAIKQVGGLNNHYTVGATDIGQEGKFFWNDASYLPTSSELWNTNEPNNIAGNEDCVEAFVSDDRLLINDYRCDLWRYFICQYDP